MWLLILSKVALPGLLALLDVVDSCEEVVPIEQPLDGRSLARVAIQAALDETSEGSGPFRVDLGRNLIANLVETLLPISDERWPASCKLEGEPAERPDIKLFRVQSALGNLG